MTASTPILSDRRFSHPPLTAGTLTRLTYARAKTAGVAVAPMLAKANLSVREIRHPSTRLGVSNQITFVNLAAAALHDEFLGFHLAQSIDLRELGLLYYVLASSETLLDALKRTVRYSTIANEAVSFSLTERPQIGFAQHLAGVRRNADRHQTEFALAALIRACRQITGQRLVPRRVKLIHRRERSARKEFAALFGADVQFGADRDEITFDKRVGNLPVVNADHYLNRILVQYCEDALGRRQSKRVPFRSVVENAIVPLLPHGGARADRIAYQLGFSRRTFERRLADEGLTFSEILETLRLDLANRYLADKELSISQIAWLIGYLDVAAFSHAYKRWTGKTPRDRRPRGGKRG